MGDSLESLPNDVDALKAALVAERGRRIVAEADAAFAKARASDDQALIAHLKLQIEKLNRDRYGPRSERTARLLDQLELTLEELEATATEDELAAEMAAARTANATTAVASFARKRPSRQPFPDHLPRQRVIVPGPTACLCCGGERLRKFGRDRHRNAGIDSAAMEGDPARPGEVHLPGLREDQPGAGAIPRHCPRLGWTESAGDGVVREIWPASAAQPAGGALCQGRRADQPVDLGRSGWRLHGRTDAVVQKA